nr:hypothetical protein [Tanacetum cinerariifolium]
WESAMVLGVGGCRLWWLVSWMVGSGGAAVLVVGRWFGCVGSHGGMEGEDKINGGPVEGVDMGVTLCVVAAERSRRKNVEAPEKCWRLKFTGRGKRICV